MAGSFCAAGAARLFTLAATPSDSEFSENDLQRTKISEGGLQQVKADEGGKPKPVRAMVVRQDEAQEDERAGKPSDDHLHFHNIGEIWSGNE
jgi:hypothetical protein